MKNNIYELFLNKVLNMPLWIKQALYLKLTQEMTDNCCINSLNSNPQDVFSAYKPTLTFKGKTELLERKCGLDINIYNFLECCANNYSILEISVNTFLSMEEVAKHYELCLEQNFIKAPESKEIAAMAGFIAGKYRIGEYFKQKGMLDVDQLQKAIINYKSTLSSDENIKFGDILAQLNFVNPEEMKALLILKEESKKRFILDYNNIPKPAPVSADEKEGLLKEISSLKEENKKLKQKLLQLLEMVKRNG